MKEWKVEWIFWEFLLTFTIFIIGLLWEWWPPLFWVCLILSTAWAAIWYYKYKYKVHKLIRELWDRFKKEVLKLLSHLGLH